ncbi:MAG: mRNA surveillance protein pelota [Candidatus Diapherotrites archaeon]|nr:mRNA surveillance protein pelota [Candidatus Diapherotrites archaeon]
MKVIFLDKKNNYIEILPESLDDLWHISKILDIGDIVKGNSERKIKPTNNYQKPFRLKIFVELEVSKVEFSASKDLLRISGKIVSGYPEEYIEVGAFHTLDLLPGVLLKLKKQRLYDWQIEKIKRTQNPKKKLYVLLIDDESAEFYLLKDFSKELIAKISLERSGKRFGQQSQASYKELKMLIDNHKPNILVIAGPGFEKEILYKFLMENSFKQKVVLVSTSCIGETGINELMQNESFLKEIGQMEILEETNLIEKFFEYLGKSKPVAYSLQDVEKAASLGAIDILLVSDSFFHKERDSLEMIFERVEDKGGKIRIISSECEAKKKLDSVGGIAAFLRFPISY